MAAGGEATREVRVPTPAADATHTDSHVEASIARHQSPSTRSKEIASPTGDSSAQYLIHLIDRVPDDKWATPCQIGGDAAIPFSKLIENYARHCEEVLAKILARA